MQDPTFRDFVRSPQVASLRHHLDARRLLHDAVAIQQIPAPTFDEAQRAAFLKQRFEESHLRDVVSDQVHNIYGRWPGADPERPALLVSAHTDTVFPADTDLTIRCEEGYVFGPGIGDNSLGAATLLALLDTLSAHNIHPQADIWLAANSREEGLGDLGGIRAIWEKLGSRLGAAVVLEGMSLGRIYHAGIAVRRLHITCHAPGGHSWQHFGQPSAIHGLVELGARITALTPPQQPRTTYNIGLISGGQTVNSLAAEADLYLDLRSEDRVALIELEDQVRNAVAALQAPRLDFSVEVVGDRPPGRIPSDHPLVTLASAALDTIGVKPVLDSGSTDANLLLARGLPTVTVGVTRGGHAHRLDEFIETAPLADGLWQILLLVLTAANRRWASRPTAAHPER